MSLLYCPVASEQPIRGAGGPVNEGYRSHLLQDVPDQSCYLSTSRTHVLGLAFLILLQGLIFPVLRFLLVFPATNNNEAIFLLPHVPVGDRMFFKHHRRLPQVGMVVVPFFPKAYDALPGPELTLRQLRGRLRLSHPHWPAYPNEVGVILGDFNICDPEGGRLNVWNQTFTDDDPVKTAVFHSFFPHVLEIAQPDYTRRDSTVLGIIRTLSRIDRIFINLPMSEARDVHCSFHVFENLGNRTIPSDHAAVRLVIQKPTNRVHRSKRIHSWMSKHPVFCSLL